MIDFLSEMSSDHDEICFEKGNKEMLKLRENFRQLAIKGMHLSKEKRIMLMDQENVPEQIVNQSRFQTQSGLLDNSNLMMENYKSS